MIFWHVEVQKSSGLAIMAAMELPALLVEAFDGEQEAVAWTLALKEWMLRELSAWVMEPKSEASRKKRADRMAERLMLTMDAERELPVFLVQALYRAGAMKGWKALTDRQRLMLLLAVYRPVGMEGRERQVQRLVDAAVAKMVSAREKMVSAREKMASASEKMVSASERRRR
jgi:uncharacterized protein YdeI (YjbR/CyaY-like superfamily)